MSKVLKKFVIAMIVLLGIGIVLFGIYIAKSKANMKHEARNNTECRTNERVFDYADKLSDSEEEELRNDIKELEDLVGMDVAVVTVDQDTDLSEFGASATGGNIESNTKDIAEKICDTYRFGWEEWPTGTYLDGRDASTSVVIVANWQPTDRYVYLCTSGKARERISDSKAVSITKYGGKKLREDPFTGFERILKKTKSAMKSSGGGIDFISLPVCALVALVASIIFFAVNFSKKAGNDTTTASTYSKGRAQVVDKRDIFIRKEVHSVKIESSSGGGGSSSGGGGGHGGGGSHF